MEEREERAKVESIVKRLYEEFVGNILGRLGSIADETKRYLVFLSWLNSRLEEEGLGRIIVTGGFAVEVYTGRTHRTLDVDIIVEDEDASRIVEDFLRLFSEKVGRGYLPYYEALTVKSIDIVSTKYSRIIQPTILDVDGRRIYLDPPEELIVTYLAGWKFWDSSEDRDKALWLYIVWSNKLDKKILGKLADLRDVYDKLVELEELVK